MGLRKKKIQKYYNVAYVLNPTKVKIKKKKNTNCSYMGIKNFG